MKKLKGSIKNISYEAQLTKALADVFGKDPFLTREGGSIPIVNSFASVLGAPTVLMGFGLPEQDAHSPNEKMNLKNFHKGVKWGRCAMRI